MTGEPAGLAEWAAAVELGAQGRAAAARTALEGLAADRATAPAVRSLVHSTRASLTRQAGGHALARAADGRACALAVAADRDPSAGPWLGAAWTDGLVGLAADNLGIADFAASERLLDRAADWWARSGGRDDGDWRAGPRTALRLSWVRAEWGLYSGALDVARRAVAQAAAQAERLPSPRHRLKTGLIAAAVAAAGGELAEAASGAWAAYDAAAEQGLLPLQWAAATLLAGVDAKNCDYPAIAAGLRAELARRGMPLAPLRSGERLAR